MVSQKVNDGKKSCLPAVNDIQMGLVRSENPKIESPVINDVGSNFLADSLPTFVTKDNIGLMNRPLLLMRQLDSKARNEGKEWIERASQSNIDHLFRIEFDPSSGIPPCWVDTKTLNFFNTLRDNIFASSSQYDKFMPSNGASSAENLKKKKRADSSTITVDKSSVAFQRGKRSCTLTDMKSQGHTALKDLLHNA